MNREEQYIEMEAARIDSSEQYFSARPQIDTNDRRRVFEAGFDSGWRAALNSQAKSVPEGWQLVPKIGTTVKAKHPITCINPEEYFAVDEIQAFGGNITVRGENTCWFGMNTIAAPQSKSIEADKVRELEKEVSLWKSRANQLSCAGDGQTMSDYWLEVDALVLRNQEATSDTLIRRLDHDLPTH